MDITVAKSDAACAEPAPVRSLRREIGWKDAFWVASGAPALVLFSIGGLTATAGKLALAVWAISMTMGFIQSFTYAEIAGLYPNKSGGASIYGAAAWVRYAKVVAPLSVWCNWVAWTSVLSLGSSIAASYVLNVIAPVPLVNSVPVQSWIAAHAAALPADAAGRTAAAIATLTPAIRGWSLLHGQVGGVSFALNGAFFIGAALMFAVFAFQHRGIGGTASIQRWLGLAVIVPLAIIGVVPILLGKVDLANFYPLAPAAGDWSMTSLTAVLGSLFIAGWSTYGFETAVCYTSEFRDPAKDTFKAIFYSGLLCLALFVLVPFTFQGVLGMQGLTDPSIADGSGVARALAYMVGGGPIVLTVLILLMVLAVLLSVMTGMAGSSRTLYQGAVDGWLPRYLGRLNHHGAPTSAMWTDLGVNLVILAVAVSDSKSFFMLLAISNCCYMIFNFLNLNAGWIHRIDSHAVERPYRAPTAILAAGGVLSFVNLGLMGAGAKVWSPYALWAGLGTALLIVPMFCFRHYVQDRGRFPNAEDQAETPKRAGLLPYLTLAAGLAVILIANHLFRL